MDPVNQGESSGGPSVQPMKRGRGRPRKDPSLKRVAAARAPIGFERPREYPPQNADSTVGIDYMVGQAVSGVIEATFDAGYLLSVRIGNSNTSLRGVVFKPGHYIPVTAENDVVPHVQMIRRNNVHLPAESQGLSRGQRLATQAAAVVPAKRRYVPPPTAPSVPPAGLRGNAVPVVLQPVNFPNGLPTSSQPPSDAFQNENMLAFGDKDVHMVEPISMLAPDRSIPVGQIFATNQTHSSRQVSQGSEQSGSLNDGTETAQEDEGKPVASTDVDTSGSSQMSDIEVKNGKEALKSSTEDSGNASNQESQNTNEPFLTNSSQNVSVTKALLNFGTGRMTELLQAVQENMKDSQVKVAEPTSTSEVGFQEIKPDGTDPKNDASVA